ncbi:MAG: dTDP-4-dehydrorhamnose reductase [Vicinamibacteria bacterium]|nr:dTDP-4-dehydrorhamnose reductase [Vicinamibacteria bacterium]
MRILLIGAGGQLGRQMLAQNQGHDIAPLLHQDLDITKFADVRAAVRAHRPDLVLNAAAFNDVDRAQSDPDAAFRGNALGPRNLSLAAAEAGAAVLHVSTDYVFDGQKTTPYHEYDQPAPLSHYGRSKCAGEVAVRELNPRHYVVRTAWVYETHGTNFPKSLYFLALKHKEVRVVSDVKGSPTSAVHLARSILCLIETGAFGTYHLAGAGEGASWFDLATHFFKALGIDTTVIPVPASEYPHPAPRPAYSVLRTIQDPQVLLPAWQDGVAEFARDIKTQFGDLAR